jgi:DNA end-binding protein Ku
VKSSELELARQLVDGLAGSFDPSALASDYRRDLRALLEAKLRGEELVQAEPVVERVPALDLLEALKASVAAAKTGTKAQRSKPAAKAKKAPARKPRSRSG